MAHCSDTGPGVLEALAAGARYWQLAWYTVTQSDSAEASPETDIASLAERATEMQIVAAVFAEGIDLQPAPGPSTKIELTGIQFSVPASEPLPTKVTPHLVVLVWNPPGGKEVAALEVQFRRQESGEIVARNAQPLQIEPGKFNYRLIRAELEFEEFGTIVALCRIDSALPVEVPFTLLPPA